MKYCGGMRNVVVRILCDYYQDFNVLGDTAVRYGWAPSDQRINVLVKMIMIDKPILVR